MTSLGDKIFTYTKPEIERDVDGFLGSIPGLIDRPPPIIAEALLEMLPDVKQIVVIPLLAQQFKVEAMVLAPVFMHRDLTVAVDQAILDHRDSSPYNMAMAEELGHIRLHRAVMLDIHSCDEFAELQRHPRWVMAEHDAKFWGRALLMPRALLEPAAAELYRRVASEFGFGDSFKFAAVFVSHLASLFDIPKVDAEKRVNTYTRDLRGRLERSIAARSERLLSIQDSVSAQGPDRADAQRSGSNRSGSGR